MHVDRPHIVNHIANLYRVRLVLKFELVRFSHGPMRYQVFISFPSERQTHCLRDNGWNVSFQPDTIIISHFCFYVNVKCSKCQMYFRNINPMPVYIPQAKACGFDGGVLKYTGLHAKSQQKNRNVLTSVDACLVVVITSLNLLR